MSQSNRLHTFIRSLDRLGGRLLHFRKHFVHYPSRLQKILLISIDSVRNVLQTIPAIQLLKDSFPDAQIDVVTWEWTEPLLRKHPAIHEVFTYNPEWFIRPRHYHEASSHHGILSISWEFRKLEYDALIVFQRDFRLILLAGLTSAPYRIGYGDATLGVLLTHSIPYHSSMPEHLVHFGLLEPLGIKPYYIAPVIFPPPEDVLSTHSILAGLDPARRIIVIHPGGASNGKPWPTQSLIQTCQGLVSDGHQILLILDPMETAILDLITPHLGTDAVQLWNFPTIGETMALAKKADLFIGLDSGAAFVMAASGTRTLILSSRIALPKESLLGSQITIVSPAELCSFCQQMNSGPNSNPSNVCNCLEHIHSDHILSIARQQLASSI